MILEWKAYLLYLSIDVAVFNSNELNGIDTCLNPEQVIVYITAINERLSAAVYSLHSFIFDFKARLAVEVKMAHQIVSGARNHPVRVASVVPDLGYIISVRATVLIQRRLHFSDIPEDDHGIRASAYQLPIAID